MTTYNLNTDSRKVVGNSKKRKRSSQIGLLIPGLTVWIQFNPYREEWNHGVPHAGTRPVPIQKENILALLAPEHLIKPQVTTKLA
jgi:hypothetical protein